MTKAELIERVARESKISKSAAERALNSMTSNIEKCLRKKDKISLTGFGTFLVVRRQARQGRNPQTGALINIRSCMVPKFKAGKQLREVLATY